MMKSVAEATDMRLVQLEDYAEHYARTLAHWRERFDNQLEEISNWDTTSVFSGCGVIT